MKAANVIDVRLKQYATATQAKYIDAVNEAGSVTAGAKAIGVHKSTVQEALKSAKSRAATAGFSPEHDMVHTVPDPFVMKGVSTLYDDKGDVRQQWVKTSLSNTRMVEAVKEWITWLVKEAEGKSPVIPAPKHVNADILAVYPMGDPHFGMYAWAAEAGSDFDLDIAERLTKAAIDRLVDSAPPAETAIILELGDFFHADDNKNVTPGHGNALDVDTRWARVMQVGLRAMVYVIERAATKHAKVIVRIKRGNHDPHSSFALALSLDAYFRNNERVDVDLSPAVHWYYRFGKVLIGSTHGDTTKMNNLPGVMAADRPKEWGESEYRYWYCGHVHHKEVKEFPGVVCEYFRTLAAADAWHAGQGYRAGRDMCCIVHHRNYGEVERHRCDIAMLEKEPA